MWKNMCFVFDNSLKINIFAAAILINTNEQQRNKRPDRLHRPNERIGDSTGCYRACLYVLIRQVAIGHTRGHWHIPHAIVYVPLGTGFIVGNYPPQYWSLRKLTRKLLRLLLPMFFFGLGFSLLIHHGSLLKALGFIWAPEKNGYWYLMSLSVFYVSLVVFRLNKSGRLLNEIIIAVCTWAAFYLLWKYTAQERDLFCMLDCGNYYPFFILGVFARKYKLMERAAAHNWVFSVALIGYFVLLAMPLPIYAADTLRRHIFLPLCMVTVLSVLFLARHGKDSRLERCAAFVGRHTLDIYVIHYFFLMGFQLSTADVWLEATGNVLLSLMLSSAITLVVIALCIGVGQVLRRSRFISAVVYGEW